MTEADYAACVARYFAAMPGWRVHHEVKAADRIADLVVTDGKIVHVIEVKTSQSLQLIEQILRWQGLAHRVSAAVPWKKSGRSVAFRWALREMGAGLLIVDPLDANGLGRCREDLAPRLNRKILRYVPEALRDEQTRPDEWAHAGVQSGSRYTPFLATSREVQSFVSKHPGCTMRQIVEQIRHHYASDATARSSLSKWISSGVIGGIEARGRDGYFPKEAR